MKKQYSENKKIPGLGLVILVIALVVVLIVLVMALPFIGSLIKKVVSEKHSEEPVSIIQEFDESKAKIISENYDFIYKSDDFEPPNIGEKYFPTFLMDGSGSFTSNFFLPWYGNGAYLNYSLPLESDNFGCIILHPKDIDMPRFVAQNVSLPNDELVLFARIANIADYIITDCTCSDAIIKIKIIDRATNREEKIYETVINSKDGWKDIALDISKFADKDVSFIIEGYAGGPCSEWCAEFASVDKFYIATI